MPAQIYVGRLLRVDLSTGAITREYAAESTLKSYIGGTGLGVKYLYDEAPPSSRWNDPENRLIICSGPLGGTAVGGSGNFSVVTKGALTGGATSSQASGFFGADLRSAGFDGIVISGSSPAPRYLHIRDGTAELRDARHLMGQDTWQTEDSIKRDLGKAERQASVFSIGVAGENLVKFAAIVGDKSHVVAHNGVGAVMGSKKLKAIVVERGAAQPEVADRNALFSLARELSEKASSAPFFRWGTLGEKAMARRRVAQGTLPVKNYTTNFFPNAERMSSEHIFQHFKVRPNPCWACQFHHCHLLEFTLGPHAGLVAEEPEYEQAASLGPLIGQEDMLEMVALSNEVDRLGIDTNETGWLIAWLMDCYERGLVTRGTLGGIDLTWGNMEATRALLGRIARREGFGNILAEGIRAAAQRLGGEAARRAIYTAKGNTPRTHDHRSNWPMMLDTCVSDMGTDEDTAISARAVTVGLPAGSDPFTSGVASRIVSGIRGRNAFDDSLGVCKFNLNDVTWEQKAALIRAATGWDFAPEEARRVGTRIVNLLRAFNVRHGVSLENEGPSERYGSSPSDGPYEGTSILPQFRDLVRQYNAQMGWDLDTGKPLPDTLRSLGLEQVIPDVWPG